MNYNIFDIRFKLEQYYNGQLSREELGSWNSNAYYDLLRGGYVELSKIQLYPFIKKLSTFRIKENDQEDKYPCSEEEVINIWDILMGRENYEFNVEIALPPQIYSMFSQSPYMDLERLKRFSDFKNIVEASLERGTGQDVDFDTLIKIYSLISTRKQKSTVFDLLEKGIKNNIEVYLCRMKEMTEGYQLYTKGISTIELIKRMMRYLECYVGERSFHLFISYNDGKVDIDIQI